MSTLNRYVALITYLIGAGPLTLATSSEAAMSPMGYARASDTNPRASGHVAHQLAEIRNAVSIIMADEATQPATPARPSLPAWQNWHNWGNSVGPTWGRHPNIESPTPFKVWSNAPPTGKE